MALDGMGDLVSEHGSEERVVLDEVDQARVDKDLLCRQGERVDLRLKTTSNFCQTEVLVDQTG